MLRNLVAVTWNRIAVTWFWIVVMWDCDANKREGFAVIGKAIAMF